MPAYAGRAVLNVIRRRNGRNGRNRRNGHFISEVS
jgi:hypothetical protein